MKTHNHTQFFLSYNNKNHTFRAHHFVIIDKLERIKP